MRKSVVLCLCLGLPVPALAGTVDLTHRDAACVHVATVQYLDCEVAVLYTCPAVKGLATPLVREESFTDQGLDTFEVDTANGGMVLTGDAAGSYVIRTDVATLKETSMAEVMKTGKGAFVAKGSLTMFGATKPASQKITVEATGETTTLSGVPMVVLDANVAINLLQPLGPTTSSGKAYLVPSLGVYLSGEEASGTFFKPDKTPHKPMGISMPGQPGFDATKPSFCGGSLSLLDTATALDGVPA